MSDLPERTSLNTYSFADWPAKQDVLAAYKYGVLKSRDEMNTRALADAAGIDGYAGMKLAKEMLDAAWGEDADE